MMGGALSLIFQQTIRPRQEELRRLEVETPSLTERIGQAKRAIKSVQELEAELAHERSKLRQTQNGVDGSASVWMQEQLQDYFRTAGLPNSTVRLNNTEDDAASPGYQRFYWTAGIKLEQPAADLRRLISAAGGLESAKPVFKIVGLATLPDAEKPDGKIAVISLLGVGKK
jgi:hypothetical protein